MLVFVLRVLLQVAKADSAQKEELLTAELAEEKRKSSELWEATLAVDSELTRVEGALAEEEKKQGELIKEFSSKKVELSLQIRSLEDSLASARADLSQKEARFTTQLQQKEEQLQKVRVLYDALSAAS